MSANFRVAFKKSNGNLHVSTRGDFDGTSACELINLLHEQYDGTGRVFTDTHSLREMDPFGCSTFRRNLDKNRLPADRLFFKGEKGYEIALRGSKVIVPPKEPCRCNGNCVNCPCSDKKRRN